MAVSGEFRRLGYQVQSNSPPTTPVDCTGIQFNCTPASIPYLGGQSQVLHPVSQTVVEAAYETDAPILAGLPFAKAFNVNGAVRYTDYATSGGVWTWKLGGDWRIDDDLTMRATQSRDIRAPNLTELYAPQSVGVTQYVDIHTGASGVIENISQGNRDLKPEQADTTTAGFVWRPQALNNFSLSVDAYRISIGQAIVSIGGFQPATQAACEASHGTAQVCSLYVRTLPFSNTTAANYPLALLNEALNVASLETYGLDIEATYSARLVGRKLALRALFNWEPHLLYNNGPAGLVDVGGAADGVGALPPIPSTKLVLRATYALTDVLTISAQERWRGPLRQNGAAGLFFADGLVPPAAYTDVTFDYAFNTALSAFLNIQNLFNTPPAPWSSAGGSLQPNYLGGFAQGDDIIGRYFTVGLRVRM
jgi:outer membrane receptor protein involved in Fe transport